MDNIFDRARAEHTVSSVLSILNGADAEAGRFTECPVCGSGRFQITRDGRAWSCWAGRCHEKRGDGSGGRDAVGLASVTWQVSRFEAAKRLTGDALPDRLDVPRRERNYGAAGAVSDDLTKSPRWQAWLSGIVNGAQAALADPGCDVAKRARVYLCRRRGLSPDTVKTHGLGLVKQWVSIHDAELGRKLTVAPGIIIPWAMPGGLTGAIVRELHEPLPAKYMMASGSRRGWAWPGPMFTWDGPWGYRGPLLIVEGELDAMAAQEALAGLVAVKTIGSATSGPRGLVESERVTLSGFTKLLIAADADAAGDECRAMWREWSPRAVSLTLPAGFKDLGEAHAAGINLREWYIAELARLGVSLGLEPGCFDHEVAAGSTQGAAT